MAITYSISGGTDSAKFNIDGATGKLTFKTAPDFEAPGDANKDNIYEVTVKATDATGAATTQNVRVTVKDVSENAPPQITSAAAVTVDENTMNVLTVTAIDPDEETPPINPPPVDSGAWPDATNRPVMKDSTTLQWTGPAAGGPSTSSDTRQTKVLVVNNGNYSTKAAGEVVEGKDIRGTLYIGHNNVTVKRCRVLGGDFFSVNVSGTAGIVIEDCLIDGTGGTNANKPNSTYMGISRSQTYKIQGVTVRRCNIMGTANQITTAIDSVFEDNWFHGNRDTDDDQNELYGGTRNVITRHNTFDSRDATSQCNAGVNLTDTGGGVSNVQVINNRFLGTKWGICDADNYVNYPNGSVTWSCTGNGFHNVSYIRRNASTCSPNSGNFIMASADATTGSPVNGSGAV